MAGSSSKAAIVVDGLGTVQKAKTLEKKEPTPVTYDYQRQAGPDRRDPRFLGEGPCGQNHDAGFREGKNRWTLWKLCVKCGLRLQYVPVVGAAGNQGTPDPEQVRTVLQLLKTVKVWDNMASRDFRGMFEMVKVGKHIGLSPEKLLEALNAIKIELDKGYDGKEDKKVDRAPVVEVRLDDQGRVQEWTPTSPAAVVFENVEAEKMAKLERENAEMKQQLELLQRQMAAMALQQKGPPQKAPRRKHEGDDKDMKVDLTGEEEWELAGSGKAKPSAAAAAARRQ